MKTLFDTVSYQCSKIVTKSYSTSFSLATKMLSKSIRNDFNNFSRDLEDALENKISLNPILNSFQYTYHKYDIDKHLVDAFMASMRLDLHKTKYLTEEEFKTYIYGSADVVGLMCLKVFVKGDNTRFNELKDSAMSLGSAFQKVNFLRDLKALNANLNIVVAFRMLPRLVWHMPELGTFNLHASLLPNYRGAAPINWAIINGETKTGVSTFFIDEKIDTGDMILQEDIEITPDENAGSLHDKLMNIGSQLVLKTVSLIEKGNVKTIPQQETKNIKTAYKLNRDNCKINWQQSMENIYNLIRGLSPYPSAWCQLINGEDSLDVKIIKAGKQPEQHSLPIGKIISTKKELKVAVTNGYILLEEIKLPGKRAMDVKSLLNGYSFDENAKML